MQWLLEFLVSGRLWMLKGLLLAVGCALTFSTTSAVLMDREETVLPPAYVLKSQDPFADTSRLMRPQDPGERSHGAKLTPRIVGSVLLWGAAQGGLHPYVPATVFGLVFLLSGIRTGYLVSGDRLVGVYTGLCFSGLYATSACFTVNFMAKPFDGVALGSLGLAMIAARSPAALLAASLMCLWTDERGLIGLGCLAVLILVWPAQSRRDKARSCAALVLSVLLYVVSRASLSWALHWNSPDASLVGIMPRMALSYFQLANWSAFEGGWIAIVLALHGLLQERSYARFSLLLSALLSMAVASTVVVLDASRTAMYAYPLIPAAIAVLSEGRMDRPALRRTMGLAAMISVLAPNLEVIMGIIVQWLPPHVVYLLNLD
jgi:hypothetical protein